MKYLGTKIKFDKTFIICILISFFTGQIINLAFMMIAVIFHEMAHSFIAYSRGYILDTITFMPYGALLSGEDEFKDDDAIIISFAGPIFSFVLALLTVSVWWIFPKLYEATNYFFKINIALAIFNILPIFPLDGGRILLAKAKDKKKMHATLKKIGVFASIVFFALFILSTFYKINFYLGIMSISLFISSAFTNKNNDYVHISKKTFNLKNSNNILENKIVYLSKSASLIKLLKAIDTNYYLTVKVIDDNLEVIYTIEEKFMQNIFLNHKLDEKIEDIIPLRNHN